MTLHPLAQKLRDLSHRCACDPIPPSLGELSGVLLGLSIQVDAILNTPEVEEFDKAVPLEAAHARERWGVEHDKSKNPEQWFWVVGYLAGKALAAVKAGDVAKAKHHCISTAGALRNWHAHIRETM